MQPSGPQGIIHTVAKAFENVVFIQCTENKCLLYGSVCHFLPSAVRNKKGTVHCKVLTCVKCHYNSGSRLIFSFLCCLSKGESGLGKSTLINSLFLTDLYPERIIPGAAGETSTAISVNQETAVWRKKKKKNHSFVSYLTEKIERTVQIEASTVEIEERGVKLRLTVVDTPGYGDAINSQDWLEPSFPLNWTWVLLKLSLMTCSCSRPVSAPSSATSTTSLNATSTTRAALIADTLLTIGSTAASILSPPLATGELRSGCCLFYRLFFLFIPLFSFLSTQPETPGCSVHEGYSQ